MDIFNDSQNTKHKKNDILSSAKKRIDNTKATLRLFKYLLKKGLNEAAINEIISIDEKNKVINNKNEEIEKLKIERDTYKQLSEIDSLTRINNKGKILELLSRELQFAKRENLPLTVFMIDIDYFKLVNDTFGHEFGDSVLKSFAQTLKKCVRTTDHIGRYGGEEFLVVCTDTRVKGQDNVPLSSTARFGTKAILDRLIANIRNMNDKCLNIEYNSEISRKLEKSPLKISEDKLSLICTASIGSICIDESKLSTFSEKELIELADKALYKAKNTGRNKYVQLTDKDIYSI